MLNYECATEGGYRRIGGYERFDGRPSPSLATFSVLRVTASTGTTVIGDTINGVTSGASGVVCDVSDDDSEYAIVKITGAFVAGEQLTVSAVPIGTLAGLGSSDHSSKHQAQLQQAAADLYRDDILRVPGSGPISVAALGDKKYAWRANDAGDDLRLFESTSAGWLRVGLGSEVYFKTGTVEVFEGQTVSDATLGGTALVTRVVLQSGSWASGDAAGKFVVSNHSGGFYPGNVMNADGVASAIVASACAGIKLDPGGKVLTRVGIVGGAQGAAQRLYGCDGVNRGFEFDGGIYVPIDTGMNDDKPTRVALFKKHLFFAFGRSIQHSAIADPYSWTVITGAAELSVDFNVADFNVKIGDNLSGSMIIHTEGNPYVLYGNSSADWQLQSFNTGVKGVPNTSQNIGSAYCLCDHGVTEFTASQNFGNFESATLTANIAPIIAAHRGRAAASAVQRSKSQYRIFYSDGFGLYLTIDNGKYIGCGTVFFPDQIYTACEGKDSLGNEVVFVGSESSGYVYQLDAGTSFDGLVIPSLLVLPFASPDGSRVRKLFRRASIDISDLAYSQFGFSFAIDYGDTARVARSDVTTYTRNSDMSVWDAFTWDAFAWDGQPVSPTVVDINARGVNIAMRFTNSLKFLPSFTINTITLHTDGLREARN